MEESVHNINVTSIEEDIEWTLNEIEKERQEIRDKLISGEYKVYEGRVYNSNGDCIGKCNI